MQDRTITLTEVRDRVAGLRYMTLAQAEKLEGFFAEQDIADCLELGFYHGVSSAYMAAILEARGRGHLTTIDLVSGAARAPNIDALLGDLGLSHRVTVHYEPRCFTWRLMRMIEADPGPRFDFAYIDGAHTWLVTGYAFLLVERLLRPGGWVLFDDLDFTYATLVKPGRPMPDFLRRMTAEERATPQVRKVWDLLVGPHPAFHNHREDGRWAFAQKR
jgi:predicted O-methyltransferase YrrM